MQIQYRLTIVSYPEDKSGHQHRNRHGVLVFTDHKTATETFEALRLSNMDTIKTMRFWLGRQSVEIEGHDIEQAIGYLQDAADDLRSEANKPTLRVA